MVFKLPFLKTGEMRKMPLFLYQIRVSVNGKKLKMKVCLEKGASDVFILANTRAKLSL